MSRADLDWIVYRLIPKPGLVMLMGPPKAGKSFLALQVALSVARGEDFLGQATKATRVLYLQLDTSELVWRERLHMLRGLGEDIDSPPVFMIHPDDTPTTVDVLRPGGVEWLRGAIAATDPGLVIVDTLREIHSGDENESTDMKRVGDALRSACRGRAALFVHHTKKIPADATYLDPVNLARGSNYLTGLMDAYWLLDSPRGRLIVVNRFDEDATYTYKKRDGVLYEFEGIEEGTSLVKLCKEFPERTHAELAKVAKERLGMSRATYYRRMAGRTCVHHRLSQAR